MERRPRKGPPRTLRTVEETEEGRGPSQALRWRPTEERRGKGVRAETERVVRGGEIVR